MKKRRNSQKVSEATITSFCIVLVEDPFIINEPCILMVNNIADRERTLPPDPLYTGTKPEITRRKGKRAGIGLPGGGQKKEDMELPNETAENELKRETGFTGKNTKGLFVQAKRIINDNEIGDDEDNKVAEIPFNLGQEPPYRIPEGHMGIENIVCVYRTEVEWEGSNFQKLLHRIKKDCKISPEEIRQEGLYVWFRDEKKNLGPDLTKEELDSLNIVELNEIDMMGVFPLSLIAEIMREFFPKWSGCFYPSHVIRAAGACRQMGIMKEEFDEAFAKFGAKGGTFIHDPYGQAIRYLSKISNTITL